MRTPLLAMLIAFGTTVAVPAIAAGHEGPAMTTGSTAVMGKLSKPEPAPSENGGKYRPDTMAGLTAGTSERGSLEIPSRSPEL